MTPSSKAQLQIHFCVLLWGFTAILGKLITLPALPLVWWRMLLVVAALALVPRVWRGLRAMSARVMLAYAGIGALVALHWLTFLRRDQALQRIGRRDLHRAGHGVRRDDRTVADAHAPVQARAGAGRDRCCRAWCWWSAACRPACARASRSARCRRCWWRCFGSLNKRMVEHGDPLTVTALELGAGVLVLTLLAPLMPLVFPAFAGPLLVEPSAHDFALLLGLALACTLLPFSLSLVALRHMSAFAQQLAVNLEPVYAIVLAALLLGEQRELTALFYGGVAIILAAVFIHPLLGRPRPLEHPEVLGTSEAKGAAE